MLGHYHGFSMNTSLFMRFKLLEGFLQVVATIVRFLRERQHSGRKLSHRRTTRFSQGVRPKAPQEGSEPSLFEVIFSFWNGDFACISGLLRRSKNSALANGFESELQATMARFPAKRCDVGETKTYLLLFY